MLSRFICDIYLQHNFFFATGFCFDFPAFTVVERIIGELNFFILY